MKKFFSILLAALLTLSLCATAFAADITINSNTSDPGLSVNGKTFNAYKVLDLVDDDGNIYAAAAGLEDFFAARYSLDKTDNKYFNEQLTAALKAETEATEFDGFAFAAELLAAAKAAGIEAKTAVGANDSATITGLDVGYYVVEDAGKDGDEDTAISALMLQKTDDSPAITVKGSMPGITKDILTSEDKAPENDQDEDGKVKTNNGAIGELVPYVLTSKVPSRMDAYDSYTYIIHDQMSKGLTFQNNVVVKLGGEALVLGDDYTVTTAAITEEGEYNGGTAITIEILNFIQYKDKAGADIEVFYSAEINEDAVIGEVLGNPNRVRLEYSNNPNFEDEPGEPGDEPVGPTGITPWDEVRTYVTEVKIIKTDANGNRLDGAKFTLTGERVKKVLVETLEFTEDANGTFWKLTDGSYTTTDPATEGMDQSKYASTTIKYKQELIIDVQEHTESVTITGVTNDAGELIFSGLASGEYVLTETVAPEGYNLLKQPIELTITWTEPSGTSKDCIWAYSWTNADGQGNEVTVVNNIGVELPETGGMGTTLFYLAGGALVVAAAVLLITKKRMNRE